MKPLAIIAGVFATVLGGAFAAHSAGFVVNRSDSVPQGVWRVLPGAPTRGAIVLACPPDTAIFKAAKRARYLLDGVCPGGYAPLLKPIAALAGDRVEVRRDGVWVNGARLANSAPLREDPQGRPLPHVGEGARTVGAGEVWLVSSFNRFSFDSRYYGPFNVRRLRGVASPIYLMDRDL